MGAGNITVLFWGVPLADNRADLAYAMHHWWNDGSPTKMAGDAARTVNLYLCRPYEHMAGRHWLGVVMGNCDMLPKDMRDRVYTAAEAERTIDTGRAICDIGAARIAWAHFAAWCERRGLTLPEPGLYVVADYD